MREILFRGRRVDDGEWVEGFYCYIGHTGQQKHYIIPDYASAFYGIAVNPTTIGQFTGLHDKRGKRIFEGDVLRYTKVGGHSSTGIVRYIVEFARWEYWHTGQKEGFPVLSDYANMEVIGTIHDREGMK